jgi:hypothetical protein
MVSLSKKPDGEPVYNNGPLIGEYIWSKSDGDITVRKLREQ